MRNKPAKLLKEYEVGTLTRRELLIRLCQATALFVLTGLIISGSGCDRARSVPPVAPPISSAERQELLDAIAEAER